MQSPLLSEEAKERKVSFRKLTNDIPSTTYATFALYRYPAKFIPQVIAYTLRTYAHRGMTVFDPFAGYGTVGVVSKIYGLDYELWDLNPILEVLHEVATMEPREIDTDGLLHRMDSCREEFIPQWSNLRYWFPGEFLPFLFKVWGFYHSLEDASLKSVLTIPLLKTTRSFSYDDTQRQKLSKSPRTEKRIKSLLTSDWQELFYRKLAGNIREVLKGVEEYWKLSPKPVTAIVKGGVDTLTMDLDEERDILITSPPYLQAQEYIRQAKMDLFWLGYSEAKVKELSKNEIPYRDIPPCPINSEVYLQWREQIQEPHLRKTFDRYFWGVLGALTHLQEKVRSYLFLFVGSATIRARPVPIASIFAEHFTALGWLHEVTLRDTIVSRQMFFYDSNPATGLRDQRMRVEDLLVLRRRP
jgi:hypothetical protein